MVVDRLLSSGKNKEAMDYLRQVAQVPPGTDEYIWLGDLDAKAKDWTAAAADYARACAADRTRPIPLYLRGWALTQAGQAQQGRALMEHALLLPLGDEADRYLMAGALEQHGLHEEAAKQRDLVVQNGEFGVPAANLACAEAAAAAYERHDYAAALELTQHELVDVAALDRSVKDMRYYLGVLLRIRGAQAQLALAGGNVSEALAQVDRCLALARDDDVIIDAVNRLNSAGKIKESEALLAKVSDSLEASLKEFGGGASMHNSLAWLLAKCHRRLDEALAEARRAVELQPTEPAFIDTLAEVYFHLGRRAESVATMQKCVDLEVKRPRDVAWLALFKKRLEHFKSDPIPTAGD